MRKIRILIAACLTVSASASFAAPAENAGDTEAFARRLLAVKSVEQKTYACFVRVYDASHLAHHRKQAVSAMKMLVAAEKLADDPQLNYSFKVGITFRNRAAEYASNGGCGHARAPEAKRDGIKVECGGDCGGGGMAISLVPDNKAIIVKLEEIAVWLADKPEDEDAQFELKGGADDRVFRLDRVGIEECAALTKDEGELAAMRRK